MPMRAGDGEQRAGAVADTTGEPDHENDANEHPTTLFVGALPESLGYYKTHGAEFWHLVEGQPWHGWKRKRRCQGCASGDHSGLMRVQAISNAQRMPLTGLPKNGVVVGRFRNAGRHADEATEIPNHGWREKPDEYYFVITDKSDAKAATLWVARVTFDWRWNPNNSLTVYRAANDFLKCDHPAEDRPRSEGDFKDCSGNKLLDTSDSFAWFSCDGGCCSAQWPPSGLFPAARVE